MDKNLEIWEQIFQNKKWGEYPPIALVKFIATNFYSRENRNEVKILELGSGPGANIWYICREGFSAYAIDGSKTACEKLQRKIDKEGLSHQLKSVNSGNYLELLNDYDNDFFDAIIDIESLSCNSFAKTREALSLSFDKLKKDGKLFSFTFADGTWGLDEDEKDFHGLYPSEGPLSGIGFVRYTTRDDINKLYKFCNTEVSKVERQELIMENNKKISEWIIEVTKK